MSRYSASYAHVDYDDSVFSPSIDLTEDSRSLSENHERPYSLGPSESLIQESIQDTTSELRLRNQGVDSDITISPEQSNGAIKAPQSRFEVEDPSSKLAKKSKPFDIFKVWWLEIISTTLSICSLLSVASVLFVYENHPLSSWKFRYLPNSVISQLMTVARSTMMLSTASCISQSCWLHMQQKPRRLFDIHTLDGASRGPAGAVVLLTSEGGTSLVACLGAFITIATLLMESFTQQVLQYPLRNEFGIANGTFPVNQFYAPAPSAVAIASSAQNNEANLNSSIQAAIIDNFFGISLPDMYDCPTNSCSWQTSATTIGLCSSCTNVTSVVNKTCNMEHLHGGTSCNYTTPLGLDLQTESWSGSAQAGYQTRIATDARIEANTSLVTFASLTMTDTLTTGDTPYIDITECKLDWCAKVYRDASVAGRDFAVLVNDYPLVYSGRWRGPGQGFTDNDRPDFIVMEANATLPADLNSTFTIQETNAQFLADFLVRALRSGNLTQRSGGAGLGDSSSFSLGAAMLDQPSIPFVAEKLAASLTNAIRGLTTNDTRQVGGESFVVMQYIWVRWIWLILPSVVILLGFLLLITTIYQSRRAGAMMWKCSPLALLFHPLQGWSDKDLDHADADGMKKSAKAMRAQLVKDEDVGLRIMRI